MKKKDLTTTAACCTGRGQGYTFEGIVSHFNVETYLLNLTKSHAAQGEAKDTNKSLQYRNVSPQSNQVTCCTGRGQGDTYEGIVNHFNVVKKHLLNLTKSHAAKHGSKETHMKEL